MVIIVRDEKTGRIKGTGKLRPAWANEHDLRRALLMPAIRQFGAVLRYYRDGRKAAEIMRETGYSYSAVMMLLMRTRKALGITRSFKVAQKGLSGPRRRIPAKHDELRDGFTVQPARWNSRGRRYHIAVDEVRLQVLQNFFLGPAMQRYEIARLFWIESLTAGEVAARLGIKQKAVEYQLGRIMQVMNSPLQSIKVMRGVTQDGKRRDGVTAPYTRRNTSG